MMFIWAFFYFVLHLDVFVFAYIDQIWIAKFAVGFAFQYLSASTFSPMKDKMYQNQGDWVLCQRTELFVHHKSLIWNRRTSLFVGETSVSCPVRWPLAFVGGVTMEYFNSEWLCYPQSKFHQRSTLQKIKYTEKFYCVFPRCVCSLWKIAFTNP